MLAKLLKYEFRSTSRVILIIYAAILACGVLIGFMLRGTTGFQLELSDAVTDSVEVNRVLDFATASMTAVYSFLLIAMVVLTIVMIVMRFYRNLLTGEGYLMHTLPVQTWKLVASKGIVAIAWSGIALLVAVVSALLLLLTSGLLVKIFQQFTWEQIIEGIRTIFLNVNIPLMIVSLCIGTVCAILQLYFAMALGNLANEHKILFSVLAFVGIQVITNIIGTLFSFRILWNLDEFISDSTSLLNQSMWINVFLQAALCVAFFFGTTWIFKKRLNLA